MLTQDVYEFRILPWKGFSLDWFFANKPSWVEIFHDQINLESIWVSAWHFS